jgi:putative aminopeptidase FrvX
MINMNIDIGYIVNTLVKIANTPSPSGCTERVMKIVEDELASFGLSSIRSNKGSLIATVKGKNDEDQITFSAHVDTLGAMVKEIKGSGKLSITQIGGYIGQTVEGTNCIIETSCGNQYSGTIQTIKPSVHIHKDAGELERKIQNYEVIIDEKVFSKEDVENLGIDVGDFVFLDPKTTVTPSGFIKSRHLDDKASAAVLLGVIKYIHENNIVPERTINFFISNYEEVGHGAAAAIPAKTTEFISVDMGAPGEGQNSTEFAVCICAKDSSGPYDLGLKKKLVELCKEKNIDYRIDIYPYYGSDASAALRAGWDIKTGLIGPGVFASHGYERTHKDSLVNTANLVLEYICK